MFNIEQKIDIWKKKLLDLGKRNRLVNFKETKRSNISIVAPDYQTLFKRLIQDEKSLSFPYPLEKMLIENSEDQDIKILDGDLKTNKAISEQQKTLKVLRQRAKTCLEEQGINSLYLTFGMITWKESDDSNVFLNSPLVLVPVTITIESISDPYYIQLHEDEIVVNPSLNYKFENDFGIVLPEFDGAEDSITEYINKMTAIAKKNDWLVTTDVHLTLLSFLKINMYKDLDDNKDKIVSNPIIKALSGHKSEFLSIPIDFNNYDHDSRTRPIDTFQVVDADSSQKDAILLSKNGLSFVLQGPPGTGKSQTITNIIAESIADGKKVLFVSEKMAALEVVKKRLHEVGLEDFCLSLHSHKANKKDILNQLNKTLSIQKKTLREDVLYELSALEKKTKELNEYVKQLHTKCKPLDISLYEANGRLAKLSKTNDVIFNIDNLAVTDITLLNKYKYLLSELSKTIGKRSEEYSENPWYGCNVAYPTHELRNDIQVNLSELSLQINSLENTYKEIVQRTGAFIVPSSNNISVITESLELCAQTEGFPKHWIDADVERPSANPKPIESLLDISNTLSLTELANYASGKQELLNNNLSNIFDVYDEAILKINPSKLLINLDNNNDTLNIIGRIVGEPSWRDLKIKDILLFINNQRKTLEDFSEKLQTAKDACTELTMQYGIIKPESFEELTKINGLLQLIANNPLPTQSWFDDNKDSVIDAMIDELPGAYVEVDLITQSILSGYNKEIFNIDYANILFRFNTEYTGAFKLLKGSYRTDRKYVIGYSKSPNVKMTDNEIIQLLNKLMQLNEKNQWIESQKPMVLELLGDLYMEAYTKWDLLKTNRQRIKDIKSYFGRNKISPQLKQVLIDGNVQKLDVFAEVISRAVENTIVEEVSRIYGEQIGSKSIDSLIDTINRIVTSVHSINADLQLLVSRSKDSAYAENTSINTISYHISLVENIIEIRKWFSDYQSELESNFGYLYAGLDTNWEKILTTLNYVKDFKRVMDEISLSSVFVNEVSRNEGVASWSNDLASRLKVHKASINDKLNWFADLFDEGKELYDYSVYQLSDKIQKCLHNINLLEEWIDFRSIRQQCCDLGLGQYIDKVQEMKVPANEVVETFFKRFYRLWIDCFMPQYTAVNSFRTRSHEALIKEFSKLDKMQLSVARLRILERLISKLPNMDFATSSVDEVGVLKRELTKQRKIMPLRRLFKAIPNLLTSLKPCLMMSPLSVSLFLQADGYCFDTIIFDEASQVCTEDAVGAIMRGKQIIIAGDRNQLPPTNFFTATLTDSDFDVELDDEDFDDSDAFDSILEEATNAIPERTLKWHYRSRHEHLIAFSNAKIYNHELITFPSNIEKTPDNGVEYVYVENGVYDRGGKKDNVNEANRVAELVFEHFVKHPNRSLGVVTFSEAQQQAVDNAITQLRYQAPQFEKFFDEEKEEAFFIKNLENVQGDERDTIIFSIGYAKDPNGVMYMNFGPLSRNGGHRRLNVAITRAKYNVKLVGSIHPTDIKTENTNSLGVKMLRQYIEFAINGASTLQNELQYSSTIDVESPFEEAVYDFLVKNGYNVATQVGCSGYRIDMAVKHPTLSGVFVLGIECDGATYHSTRTARERDRLRQTVLEDIGWKIFRIWSTDWIKDPINQGECLLNAVNRAISEYQDGFAETEELKSENVINHEEVFIADEKQPEISDSTANEYGFKYYQEADIYQAPKGKDDLSWITNVISYIVEVEQPIHYELLCKRIAPLFGNRKATFKIRDSVDYVLTSNLKNKLNRKEDFFTLKSLKSIMPRVPKEFDDPRVINHISTEELAEMMYVLVSKSFGIMKTNLMQLTARECGYNRSGVNITQAMEKAYMILKKEHRIKEIDGKVVLV